MRLSLTAMRTSHVENLEFPWNWSSLLVGLEECILRNVFGVFTVLCNMLRDPEDLALVLTDQLLKCCGITFFSARYERRPGCTSSVAGDWMAGMSETGAETNAEIASLQEREDQYL